MTVSGASLGGLWSLLGAGIDASIKAGYPGSTATYQTSGGGLANVALIDKAPSIWASSIGASPAAIEGWGRPHHQI